MDHKSFPTSRHEILPTFLRKNDFVLGLYVTMVAIAVAPAGSTDDVEGMAAVGYRFLSPLSESERLLVASSMGSDSGCSWASCLCMSLVVTSLRLTRYTVR